MPTPIKMVTGLVVLILAVTVVQQDDSGSESSPVSSPPAPSTAQPEAEAGAEAGAGAGPLLQPAGGGDGDSWRDADGAEYRLGLVNTPEYDECYGSAATAQREELTAKGFYAQVYTRDAHGRDVAVVTTADGVDVNVFMARHGFANDVYLERFRHENPALAGRLDEAFAAAKAERAGLWGACSPAGAALPAPSAAEPSRSSAPASSDGACHPDYLPCIPVRGDGSGRGDANDLDCGSIGQAVTLARPGVDPYRLDGDGDGFGCG